MKGYKIMTLINTKVLINDKCIVMEMNLNVN